MPRASIACAPARKDRNGRCRPRRRRGRRIDTNSPDAPPPPLRGREPPRATPIRDTHRPARGTYRCSASIRRAPRYRRWRVCSAAATASATSEPVAMTIGRKRRRFPSQHVTTAARRIRKRFRAAVCALVFWRVSTSAVGPSLRAIGGAPRDCRFDRVARTPHRQFRCGAQIRQLFDRFVRRTVFAKSNGIMRVHEDVVLHPSAPRGVRHCARTP